MSPNNTKLGGSPYKTCGPPYGTCGLPYETHGPPTKLMVLPAKLMVLHENYGSRPTKLMVPLRNSWLSYETYGPPTKLMVPTFIMVLRVVLVRTSWAQQENLIQASACQLVTPSDR